MSGSAKRLIEEAFPLRQASMDSVHEKNVRHGHISTLHIWPARRPLAASRAALIAALLPAPDDPKARAELLRRMGGRLVEDPATGDLKTEGGILRWGHESDPDMDYFRAEIRKAFGGRAPKVLDMFAGGGAIPLEAMRLGCDVTAIDYNPVAWFLLKCTLEYPSKLAGQRWKLPNATSALEPGGDLAAHVRYWGNWVLARARNDLADYYPTLPRKPNQPVGDGNPLCPTVAYLWARTVPHPDPKMGGLRVPLLKTLWLCKKPGKKRALKVRYHPERNAFDFTVFDPSDDAVVSSGTMTRRGAVCPPLGKGEADSNSLLPGYGGIGQTVIPSEYIQQCGKDGKMGMVCTAVVVDVPKGKGEKGGKAYREPTPAELDAAERAQDALAELEAILPCGLPREPTPLGASRSNGGSAFNVAQYGLDTFGKLFTPRQLLALGTFVKHTRTARLAMRDAYAVSGSSPGTETLIEAISAYLAVAVDRLVDRGSSLCHFDIGRETVVNTFQRFALPMNWDCSESSPTGEKTGGYEGAIEWVEKVVKHLCGASHNTNILALNQSAATPLAPESIDAIVTDPPYYDAIPYADLSDFFYVWLKRTVGDLYEPVFDAPLTPKSGELVQHSGRDGGQGVAKKKYEDGMEAAFRAAWTALKPDGRMVIVFAHKQPDAWETLVSAMIRAGFTVTASWPIDTEMGNRTRAQNSAALSSSVWLVCRKRPVDAGKGWYKQIQPRMKERITERLRYFWDEGVRGPDFLWAAIGPGLEAFSPYDEVRKNSGETFTIAEFIAEVRRLTTDFALGQILHGGTEGLDDWTRYALMHAQNFGLSGAPVGECILLASAYGLDLNVLSSPRGLLGKGKVKPKKAADSVGDEDDSSEEKGGGAELRLLSWEERTRDDLGMVQESGEWRMIDALHRLMREWNLGDIAHADGYLGTNGLGGNDLFWRVAQAFVEMGALQSKERTTLETIISWGRGRTSTFTYSANGAFSKNGKPRIPKPQTGSLFEEDEIADRKSEPVR